MHQLPAFANMTMSVRRELCSVMVFEVVEQAGTVILHNKQEVKYLLQISLHHYCQSAIEKSLKTV